MVDETKEEEENKIDQMRWLELSLLLLFHLSIFYDLVFYDKI